MRSVWNKVGFTTLLIAGIVGRETMVRRHETVLRQAVVDVRSHISDQLSVHDKIGSIKGA